MGDVRSMLCNNSYPFGGIVKVDIGKGIRLRLNDKYEDMLDGVVLWRDIEIDHNKFNELYFARIREYFNLTKSELLIVRYIIARKRKNKNKVAFTYKMIIKEVGIATNKTVCKSIRVLIDKGIIGKTRKEGIYYINGGVLNVEKLIVIDRYIKI